MQRDATSCQNAKNKSKYEIQFGKRNKLKTEQSDRPIMLSNCVMLACWAREPSLEFNDENAEPKN